MYGYISIEFPCSEYTMWCWDEWREWISHEISLYGAERRMLSQELSCPICGGEAIEHPRIGPLIDCTICCENGMPGYSIFFHSRCPRRK